MSALQLDNDIERGWKIDRVCEVEKNWVWGNVGFGPQGQGEHKIWSFFHSEL